MAKHQNLGPGGVPLHNTPREQGLSLFITLCILNVVCVVIVFSMSGVMGMGTWGIVLTEAICLLITGVTLYSQSWGMGDKDANLIQFGRYQYDRLKPLKMGLVALAPGLVSDIILIVCKALNCLLFGQLDALVLFRLMNAPVWPLINLIHPSGLLPTEAHEEMTIMAGTAYEEVIEASAGTPGASWLKVIVFVLLPLVYLVFIWLGYELGRRRFSIGNKLVYEDKEGGKSKKRFGIKR